MSVNVGVRDVCADSFLVTNKRDDKWGNEMAEVKVSWGAHSFKGCDAQKVYLEICSIGDEVKPQQMVDYAEQNPESELHKCFTWDNDVAADKWRLAEARLIHRNLVIQYAKDDNEDAKTEVVRATFRTSTSPSAGYKQTLKILRNDDDYSGLLTVALAELRSFEKKYSILKELKPVFDAIDAITK